MFLTTMAGSVQPGQLAAAAALGASLEARKTVRVTTELRNFLLTDVEEGYYPAEYEVVAFHIFNAWASLQLEDFVAARVEARRAARYLQGQFDDRRRTFDDPILRLWLTGVWLALGEWQFARADLRRAAVLSPELGWAQRLADAPHPPKHYYLALIGPGPELLSARRKPTSFESDRDFYFTPGIESVTLYIDDGDPNDWRPVRTLESRDWYSWHQDRNHAVRQFLDGSKQAAVTATGAAKSALYLTAVGGASAVMGAASIAAGAGVFAIGVAAASVLKSVEIAGYAAIAGYGVAKAGLAQSGETMRVGAADAGNIYAEATDRSKSYPFLRFLPDHVAAGGGELPAYAISIGRLQTAVPPIQVWQKPGSLTQVKLFYLPTIQNEGIRTLVRSTLRNKDDSSVEEGRPLAPAYVRTGGEVFSQ